MSGIAKIDRRSQLAAAFVVCLVAALTVGLSAHSRAYAVSAVSGSDGQWMPDHGLVRAGAPGTTS